MSLIESEGRGSRWLFWGLLCAAAVLGLALRVACRTRAPAPGQEAGAAPPALALLAPRGDLETVPGRFEWRAVEGALRYSVKIEDADAVWPLFVRSSESTNLSLAPQEIAALLPGRVHVWEVQALDAEGRVLAGGSARFRIRAPLSPP